MSQLPFVSLVVIGRNEEKNLEAAFRAIDLIDYPRELLEVIYVDSNSTDRSVEIARQHADAVFIEDHPLPSAARGRNRGLVEARHDIVHFVDGDVQINRSYLKKAVEIITDPGIQSVSGVIRESNPRGWNHLLSSCWAAPREGIADSTATGGTFKRNAMLRVDGYDERLLLGEETELGERFRHAGFTIWSTLQEMGVHDYGIHSFSDFIRFLYKDGRVKTRTMMIKGNSAYFAENQRKAWSNIAQNIGLLSLIATICLLSRVFWLPVLLVSILVLLFIKYYFVKKARDLNTLLYFMLMNVLKPVVFAGQISEWVRIILDRSLARALKARKMALTKSLKSP
jgi:glycosyltransferase involved in cell wall biosynthesis